MTSLVNGDGHKFCRKYLPGEPFPPNIVFLAVGDDTLLVARNFGFI